MTDVKVYSTPMCPWCSKAKDFLKQNNIEFEDINVADDAKARHEMVHKSGQMGVPVLDVKGTILVGFNIDAIEHALSN